MKKLLWSAPAAILVLAMALPVLPLGTSGAAMPAPEKKLEIQRGLTEIERSCIECHGKNEPGKVHDWAQSLHARSNVTCLDCHRAELTDKDARDCPGTEKHGDLKISPVVSPQDCSQCHPLEAEQFATSKHARTWDIMTVELKDPWMRGMNNALERATGCNICHGSDLSDGQLTVENWPNSGCGRLNPDGSKGSCVLCHTTHHFNIAEARKPETCGQCHMGPDHPQDEIYFESKHGKRYLADGDDWNWEAAPDAWEPGSDFQAPTCAACHMAGIGDLSTNHDIGHRLKWETQASLNVPNKDYDPEAEREVMLKVCTQCHSPRWSGNYLARLDLACDNYNEEYFKPAKAVVDKLYADGILTRWPVFDEEIEWVMYELWHHEGRRARMGSMMMGPDYAWWHGFYDLKKTYQHLIKLAHEAREKGHGSPVYVPGSGGQNKTPVELPPMDQAWDQVEHLIGRPEK